jgi:hypothetical protein
MEITGSNLAPALTFMERALVAALVRAIVRELSTQQPTQHEPAA